MKRFGKRCLSVALVAGIFLAETTWAQTDASSIKAAKAQVKEAQAARLQAEADAKAQRESELAEQEKMIGEADALVKVGKAEEAYELLEPMEFERAGEVRFDYLLGIAELDSGKPDKATIAFERVMAVNPNFAGARMDMARAYYLLGDLPRAKTEFEEVLKQDPPEAARSTIQKYLASIDAQMSAKPNYFLGYFETAAGFDTNVNAATSQALVPLPVLGNIPITLSSSKIKTADDYFGVNGGLNVIHPLNQSVALYAGADLRMRDNLAQTTFNTMNLLGNIGGIFTFRQQDSLKLGLANGNFTLGGISYFNNAGINGEWRHQFSSANQMTLFVQQMSYSFIDSVQYPNMGGQNFAQATQGLNWTHVMKDGKSSIFGSLLQGQETDVTGLRPDGGKSFSGIRIGGEYARNDKLKLFASAGWNDGIYTRTNVIFLTARHDILTDATIGASLHWSKLWSLRPQMTWSYNQSNIPLYTYDRFDTSLTVRRDFN